MSFDKQFFKGLAFCFVLGAIFGVLGIWAGLPLWAVVVLGFALGAALPSDIGKHF